jgi:hypothetical protein
MATIADIKPGTNYPKYVTVEEELEGEKMCMKFYLQSYSVGMYCAMHLNSDSPVQGGDHDNKRFVASLKRDLTAALERGAKVTIEGIEPITK